MSIGRIAGVAAIVAGMMAASPLAAQFYLQSHDFGDGVVRGDEPGMVVPMPGATAAEYKAGLAWTLRSALNVAALQCQFEPTLHPVDTYNAILKDHDAEFDKDQATLQKYYARIPGAGAGQGGQGQQGGSGGVRPVRHAHLFGVRDGQRSIRFCQTAAVIGREALFTPRGGFGDWRSDG